jgi:CHAT domain-containing protein/tetratricopeptide (TPR) repeat protein
MIDNAKPGETAQTECLSTDQFYEYIAQPPGWKTKRPAELHLASCVECREELAELLRMLYPEGEEAEEREVEPSQAEINQIVTLVSNAGHESRPARPARRRAFEWAAAAAAVVVLSASAVWGFKYFYEKNKSEAFYARAQSSLEEFYQDHSPSGLRLDLPFNSRAVNRDAGSADALEGAKNLFIQALAVRSDMVEAHLGLGSIYLTQLQFPRARDHFQKALDARSGETRALIGRGVAQYEEARATVDPVLRQKLLAGALTDFETVLAGNGTDTEARYNRVWLLFEMGRHQDAIREIETYLSVDSQSIWAERLKSLRTRISLGNPAAFERELKRAALNQDVDTLKLLASDAPEQFARAIRSALRSSLEPEATAPAQGGTGGSDLRSAAETLEQAYAVATGDHSYRQLLKFYGGLSPPEREQKRLLDARLQALINRHFSEDLDAVLQEGASLAPPFESLQDHWQLIDLHHLRGYCYYFQRADTEKAIAEYRKMLESAERTGAADLIGKSLASLAIACVQQRRFDDGVNFASRLKEIAETRQFGTLAGYAYMALGAAYRELNAFDLSLRESSAALALGYRLRDEVILLNSLEDIGLLMDRMGRLSEAREFYREALAQYDTFAGSGSRPQIAVETRRLNLLSKQADLAFRASDLKLAEDLFNRCLASPADLRELKARIRIGLSQVYMEQRRFTEAQLMLEICLKEIANGRYPEVQWQVHLAKGQLFKQLGRTRDAMAFFDTALETLESMRRQIKSEEIRQAFLSNRFGPYKEAVALLFHEPGGRRRALDYVQRSKSMTLREYLRQHNPAAHDMVDSWTLNTGEPSVSDAIVTVEYFVGKTELFIFVAGPEGVESASVAMTPDQLADRVRLFLASARNNDDDAFKNASARLYSDLISPVKPHLDKLKPAVVAILPDGPLHMLPFAGLLGPDGQFLIEKLTLAYAPSRSVLRHCLSLRRNGAMQRPRSILLLDGTANLPGAGIELAHLSRLFGDSAHFIRNDGLQAAGAIASQSEIIHFSGHSETVEGRSSLIFQSLPTPIRLGMHDISRWRLRNNQLVNLAGCSTAVGPQAEGEAPWGLIPAFLNAGAPALVASLLPLDDLAAHNLNSRFYGLLMSGSTKAGALQKAQRALLDQARSSRRLEPLSWIPFILVGDPR